MLHRNNAQFSIDLISLMIVTYFYLLILHYNLINDSEHQLAQVDMIDRSLAWSYGNDLIADDFKEPKTMVRELNYNFSSFSWYSSLPVPYSTVHEIFLYI